VELTSHLRAGVYYPKGLTLHTYINLHPFLPFSSQITHLPVQMVERSKPEEESNINYDAPFSTSQETAIHHVDVAGAESAFNELSRQLTIRSEAAMSTTDFADSVAATKDVEKGAVSQPFDLREYLTSSNDANQRAGIRHKVRILTLYFHSSLTCDFKNVGVVWEDLQVEVAGGMDSKVNQTYCLFLNLTCVVPRFTLALLEVSSRNNHDKFRPT